MNLSIWIHLVIYACQNLFGIERHPYTKSHSGQIPCVCMYVCMYVCNYSQTTEPICIKNYTSKDSVWRWLL